MDDTTPPRRRRQGQRPTAAERARAQATFLQYFALNGIVTDAARRAGINRDTIYDWREHDEAFLLRYHQAEAEAQDVIRAKIHEVAIVGWDEPVVSMGRVVRDDDGRPMLLHKHDSALLARMAVARLPEYRDKVRIEQSGRVTVQHEFPDDPEAAGLARALLARLAGAAGGGPRDPGGPGLPGE